MKFKAWVIGGDPELILDRYLASYNQFILSHKLSELCAEKKVEGSSDNVVAKIRELTGQYGQIAVVDEKHLDRSCKRLYKAGIYHFLVANEDGVFTVNRLLQRKGEYAEVPKGEGDDAQAKFLDYRLASDDHPSGFVKKGEASQRRYGSLLVSEIDFPTMFERESQNEVSRDMERLRQTLLRGPNLGSLKKHFEEIEDDLLKRAVRDESLRRYLPHAVAWEEGWMERGKPLFYGLLQNEVPWKEWENHVFTLLDRHPQERLTLVECEY